MTAFSTESQQTWQRLFPTQAWWKTSAWKLVILAVLAGLLLAIMFLISLMVVDLFDNNGRLVLTSEELPVAGDLFGESLGVTTPTVTTNLSETIVLEDRGILATLWHFRDRLWTRPLIQLYQQMPALQQNSSALVVLLLAGAVVGLLRGLTLSGCRLIPLAWEFARPINSVVRCTVRRCASGQATCSTKKSMKPTSCS